MRILAGDALIEADAGEQLGDPGSERLPRQRRMGEDRVGHLILDAHHRIERAHRALRDERDLLQPDRAERPAAHPQHVFPVEEDAAADDPPGRTGETEERCRHRRLARAGFADQPEALAGPERERDAIDRPGRSRIGVVVDVQILDDQHRFSAGGGRRGDCLDRGHVRFASRGLANLSKPTEVRKRPRKMAAIMTIGGAHHHQ